ncbi:MAG: glutamate-5-semialdehyde dehydrogenase, partial [Clostridia bacterium]|nr:glutamate-5-semialdehyde dehydrogenase [Clostridia bacterium]
MIDLTQIGARARASSRALALADGEQKNKALLAMADALVKNADAILSENKKDLAAGEQNGLSRALLDRLALSEERIAGIAESMRHVVRLPDPVGRVLGKTERPNGLRLTKLSVPIGVIAVIFEARPNVTADSAALCLKSGNAVILRGGKEAIYSNIALCNTMREALVASGLPADCVQLIESTDRAVTQALMRLNGYVDVLIPRGGAGLIRAVVENATAPVIETGAGTCHVYVDSEADLAMAAEIVYNAKTSRPSVCNAAECMLLHRDIAAAAMPKICARLAEKGVEVRADSTLLPLWEDARPMTEEDKGREYNDYIIAAVSVSGVDEAIEYINRYGTGHSECIVTENAATARRFMQAVDAAAVYHNASTRFTDG